MLIAYMVYRVLLALHTNIMGDIKKFIGLGLGQDDMHFCVDDCGMWSHL